MDDMENIVETLNMFKKNKEYEKLINTVNVLVNLLNESTNSKSGAKLTRTFKHDRLTITVRLSDEY